MTVPHNTSDFTMTPEELQQRLKRAVDGLRAIRKAAESQKTSFFALAVRDMVDDALGESKPKEDAHAPQENPGHYDPFMGD